MRPVIVPQSGRRTVNKTRPHMLDERALIPAPRLTHREVMFVSRSYFQPPSESLTFGAFFASVERQSRRLRC